MSFKFIALLAFSLSLLLTKRVKVRFHLFLSKTSNLYKQPKSEFPTLQKSYLNLVRLSFVKGQCHEIFTLAFFYNYSNPTGPVIHILKYFRIYFRFRGDICMCKKLCSVIDAAESDSAVSLTHGVRLSCMTPRSKKLCE